MKSIKYFLIFLTRIFFHGIFFLLIFPFCGFFSYLFNVNELSFLITPFLWFYAFRCFIHKIGFFLKSFFGQISCFFGNQIWKPRLVTVLFQLFVFFKFSHRFSFEGSVQKIRTYLGGGGQRFVILSKV